MYRPTTFPCACAQDITNGKDGAGSSAEVDTNDASQRSSIYYVLLVSIAQ